MKNIQDLLRLLSKNRNFKDGLGKKMRVFENPVVCLGIIIFILLVFVIIRPSSVQEGLFISKGGYSNNHIFFEQKELANLESYPLFVIEENSFKQIAPATIVKASVLASLVNSSNLKKEVIEYIVQPGENLSQIAQKFGLSINTILWANDLDNKSTITPGQSLIILPVDGIWREVKYGETISQLAALYQVEASEIIDFNELNDEDEIYTGDLLIIPGGKKPVKSVAIVQAPLASSYFICPIPSPCHITQGLHWYNAIDFSNGQCGDPILAAAGGTIQKVGYQPVSGKHIRILHPNGVVTFYGHLSSILVVPGQQVSQGEIIGYMGNTGYTVGATGCHVHFEVRGAKNPFAY